MARDGEILNSERLQAMGDDLKIGGVGRYPKQLNLDIVQAVYDLSRPEASPNGGEGLFVMTETGNNSLEAVGNTSWIVGPGSFNNPFPLYNAYRIGSMSGLLTFTVLGSLIASGKYVALYLRFRDTDGDPGPDFPIVTYKPVFQIDQNITEYRWSLHGSNMNIVPSYPLSQASTWDCRVPDSPGSETGRVGLEARIEMIDGTNFPAGTTWNIKTTARKSSNGIVPNL